MKYQLLFRAGTPTIALSRPLSGWLSGASSLSRNDRRASTSTRPAEGNGASYNSLYAPLRPFREAVMKHPATLLLLLGLSLVAAGLTGCGRALEPADDAPTPVTVSHPVERLVTDYQDFTGRTAAVQSVEVRA